MDSDSEAARKRLGRGGRGKRPRRWTVQRKFWFLFYSALIFWILFGILVFLVF